MYPLRIHPKPGPADEHDGKQQKAGEENNDANHPDRIIISTFNGYTFLLTGLDRCG
jgi:hypothetical protein